MLNTGEERCYLRPRLQASQHTPARATVKPPAPQRVQSGGAETIAFRHAKITSFWNTRRKSRFSYCGRSLQ